MFELLKKFFAKKNNNQPQTKVTNKTNEIPPIAGVGNVVFFGKPVTHRFEQDFAGLGSPSQKISLPGELQKASLSKKSTKELAEFFLTANNNSKGFYIAPLLEKPDLVSYLDKNPKFFEKTVCDIFTAAKNAKNDKIITAILTTLNKKPLFSFFSNPAEQFLQKHPEFIALAGVEIFSSLGLENLRSAVLKELNKKSKLDLEGFFAINVSFANLLRKWVQGQDYAKIRTAITVSSSKTDLKAPEQLEEWNSFYKACLEENYGLIEKLRFEIDWNEISKEYLQSLLKLFNEKTNLSRLNLECSGLLKSIANLYLKGTVSVHFFDKLNAYPNVMVAIGLPKPKDEAPNVPIQQMANN